MRVKTVREFIQSDVVRAARTLAGAARAGVTLPDTTAYSRKPGGSTDYGSWSVATLIGLDDEGVKRLNASGVVTVGDLARAGDDADRSIIERAEDNGFFERPSAPAELLPGMVGSVATRIRYSTFVREHELRGLQLEACEDCVQPLPLTPGYPGKPGSATLIDIFTKQKCPVVHLGYICGHVQQWINLGTSLGEVVHSVALAPGESRNIAMVNWRRRQLTSLEEKTTTSERLTATFVQNRALHEVASAVAGEHQRGGSQTEASTAVTAAAFVGVGAAVGGLAMGVGGAVIGGVIGSAIEPGGGTALGTAAGGIAGAGVGAAAGAAAGGLVYAGSQALGKIMAASEGDRSIVSEVHQNITLSTSQNASAVRSIWSTVVVEDAQAENVEATTSNITNYNHMHALNVEYYEILQRYLVRIELERVEPILYLPFTFANFLNLNYVRDYWEAVRPYIDDEGMKTQGDAYFVTEDVPQVPDLDPVPPPPTPPAQAVPPVLKDLVIDVLYDDLPKLVVFGKEVPGPNLNEIDLKVRRDGREIDDNGSPADVPSQDRGGYERGKRFRFPTLDNAQLIDAAILTLDQAFDGLGIRFDLNCTVRVHTGRCEPGQNLAGTPIASNRVLKASSDKKSFEFPWRPVPNFGEATEQEVKEYNRLVSDRAKVIAKNNAKQHAYETLVENLERFKNRLQKLLLRRRHFFTRVLLNAIEPEDVMQMLESLCLRAEGGETIVRLTEVAHHIPVAMYPGGFILKLKHGDRVIDRLRDTLNASNGDVGEDLATLLSYGTKTANAFDERAERTAFTRAEEVYLPTAGLFAEAVLGRSNSAEYIDVERYFNWQDSPIPHQPPAINPVSTDSRFQDQPVQPTTPPATLNVINPVAMPDPTGMTGVLQAIQNGNMFRDMSKATELAGIIGNLSQLAGQMGQSAATMTGQAAQQAMQTAAQIGQTAANLASNMGSQAFQQAGAAFGTMGTMTGQGAMLNQAGKIDAANRGSGQGSAGPGDGGTAPGGSSGGSPSGSSGGSGVGNGGGVSGGVSGGGGGGDGGTGSGSNTGGGGSRADNLTAETFRRLIGGFATDSSSGDGVTNASLTGRPPSYEFWKDLITFTVPGTILTDLQGRNITVQPILAATSDVVNLDYYPIEITRMPSKNGTPFTAKTLLEHIRQNINLFVPGGLCIFTPYDADASKWASASPLGAVLRIDLFGPDNAAVVCTSSAPDHWEFTTVHTDSEADHPVSGQREFGFDESDGKTTFYTRGADRTTGLFDTLMSSVVFGLGDKVWTDFRQRVLEFVNDNGGAASLPLKRSDQWHWRTVARALSIELA